MNKYLPYEECKTCPANYGQCIIDEPCPYHKKEEELHETTDSN